MTTIKDIRDKFDIAIILIEHDMNLVMEYASVFSSLITVLS